MQGDSGIKKKVLVATGLYPPDIGGPATYVKMLEEQLPSLGIALTVLPFTDVRHLPKGIRHVVYAWRLWRHARNTDAVYALDSISVGVPACLVSKLIRKPFFIRLGGDYAWEQGCQRFGLSQTLDQYTAQKNTASWQVRFLASIQSCVVRHAVRVIVPSNYLKSIVATWGVKESKLTVIYSALFPLSVTSSKEQLQKDKKFGQPIISSAARLTPWKGFDVLLDVFVQVQKQYPNATLCIIGDGPQKNKLQEKAKTLGITDAVIFTGKVPKSTLAEYIKMSDVFVLNTAYEGLSHQLLEVMDLGVPIVTTEVGGNPELIKHGVSGVLVKYNDTASLTQEITRLLAEEGSVQEMITAAKDRTKDFNKSTVSRELVDVLLQNI
jgi:glycosyltransferase involved in cell wall biosynthesis